MQLVANIEPYLICKEVLTSVSQNEYTNNQNAQPLIEGPTMYYRLEDFAIQEYGLIPKEALDKMMTKNATVHYVVLVKGEKIKSYIVKDKDNYPLGENCKPIMYTMHKYNLSSA